MDSLSYEASIKHHFTPLLRANAILQRHYPQYTKTRAKARDDDTYLTGQLSGYPLHPQARKDMERFRKLGHASGQSPIFKRLYQSGNEEAVDAALTLPHPDHVLPRPYENLLLHHLKQDTLPHLYPKSLAALSRSVEYRMYAAIHGGASDDIVNNYYDHLRLLHRKESVRYQNSLRTALAQAQAQKRVPTPKGPTYLKMAEQRVHVNEFSHPAVAQQMLPHMVRGLYDAGKMKEGRLPPSVPTAQPHVDGMPPRPPRDGMPPRPPRDGMSPPPPPDGRALPPYSFDDPSTPAQSPSKGSPDSMDRSNRLAEIERLMDSHPNLRKLKTEGSRDPSVISRLGRELMQDPSLSPDLRQRFEPILRDVKTEPSPTHARPKKETVYEADPADTVSPKTQDGNVSVSGGETASKPSRHPWLDYTESHPIVRRVYTGNWNDEGDQWLDSANKLIADPTLPENVKTPIRTRLENYYEDLIASKRTSLNQTKMGEQDDNDDEEDAVAMTPTRSESTSSPQANYEDAGPEQKLQDVYTRNRAKRRALTPYPDRSLVASSSSSSSSVLPLSHTHNVDEVTPQELLRNIPFSTPTPQEDKPASSITPESAEGSPQSIVSKATPSSRFNRIKQQEEAFKQQLALSRAHLEDVRKERKERSRKFDERAEALHARFYNIKQTQEDSWRSLDQSRQSRASLGLPQTPASLDAPSQALQGRIPSLALSPETPAPPPKSLNDYLTPSSPDETDTQLGRLMQPRDLPSSTVPLTRSRLHSLAMLHVNEALTHAKTYGYFKGPVSALYDHKAFEKHLAHTRTFGARHNTLQQQAVASVMAHYKTEPIPTRDAIHQDIATGLLASQSRSDLEKEEYMKERLLTLASHHQAAPDAPTAPYLHFARLGDQKQRIPDQVRAIVGVADASIHGPVTSATQDTLLSLNSLGAHLEALAASSRGTEELKEAHDYVRAHLLHIMKRHIKKDVPPVPLFNRARGEIMGANPYTTQ